LPMLPFMLGRLGLVLAATGVVAGAALAANPHDPQKRFTSADQATARTLLVKRADLPGVGWKSERSTNNNSTCKSFNPDESRLVETAEQDSPEFTRVGGFVSSTAAIFRTSKDAQTGWNLEVRPQLLNCLAEGLDQSSPSGATVRIVSKGKLPYPHLAPRTAAFFVRLAFNVQGIKFNADLRVVCLGNGRANVALITLSPGQPLMPLPTGLDRRLASKLAQRLR
jgi:hypothetical protein